MNVADKRSFLAPDRPPPYIADMFIETETTPNPASLKFLPGQPVMQQGTREFATPEAAEASPLAQAIFDTGEVVNVFFGGDFVTVTVAPGGSWSDLKPQVLAILLDHFVSQAPLFTPGTAGGIAVPPEAEAGMLVEEASGPAAEAGIQRGDVVLSIDGEEVSSAEQMRKIVGKHDDRVALLIQRGQVRIFVPVGLG